MVIIKMKKFNKKVLNIIVVFLLFLLIINTISEKKQSINTSIKYVVYECKDGLCGGWGDRLKGIISAYGWSLLTDRYFIIQHTKPCSLFNILLPNEHDWNIKIESNNTEYYKKIDDTSFRNSLSNITNLNSEKEYILIKNNLDWLLPLSNNKHLFNKLKSLGFISDNNETNTFRIQYVFKKWYNKLFKLNPRLNEKYLNFLKLAKPNKHTKLICAQIRIGGKRDFVSYDAKFTDRNNSKIYWNYIRNNFVKKLKDDNYRIFITTDTKNVEQEAIDELGKEKVIINKGDNVHLDRENNCSNIDRVFLDFHCLQNCDMAIVSESGFGKLGVWNRDYPNENFVMFSKQGQIVIKNSTNDLFIL